MNQLTIIVLLILAVLYGLKRTLFNMPVKENTALTIFHIFIGFLILGAALLYSVIFYMSG